MGKLPFVSYIFPRLFLISSDKGKRVRELGNWGDEGEWEWEWKLNWRRNFFEWEGDLYNSLLNVISRYNPCNGKADSWRWILENEGIYTTRGVFVGQNLCILCQSNEVNENHLFAECTFGQNYGDGLG